MYKYMDARMEEWESAWMYWGYSSNGRVREWDFA